MKLLQGGINNLNKTRKAGKGIGLCFQQNMRKTDLDHFGNLDIRMTLYVRISAALATYNYSQLLLAVQSSK
jgi:hypothetical protein